MTKTEFLTRLGAELKARKVADMDDILGEYSRHFDYKLADGYSEEEIAARLGSPEELAAQFEGVARIEKAHEERYLKLLENLKNGEVFKKGNKVLWFCRNCGHVEIAESAPAVCPVCKHPQAYFQVKAENY